MDCVRKCIYICFMCVQGLGLVVYINIGFGSAATTWRTISGRARCWTTSCSRRLLGKGSWKKKNINYGGLNYPSSKRSVGRVSLSQSVVFQVGDAKPKYLNDIFQIFIISYLDITNILNSKETINYYSKGKLWKDKILVWPLCLGKQRIQNRQVQTI